MRDLRVWEVKWGRISSETILVGANSFEDAVNISVEYIRKAQSKWDAGKDDILYIKQLGNSIFIKGE